MHLKRAYSSLPPSREVLDVILRKASVLDAVPVLFRRTTVDTFTPGIVQYQPVHIRRGNRGVHVFINEPPPHTRVPEVEQVLSARAVSAVALLDTREILKRVRCIGSPIVS
jgi:hypothetical protein